MRGGRGGISSVGAVAVALGSGLGVGCGNDCGDYQYKGVRTVEWCGDVYGTEGRWVEGTPEAAWGELNFGHDAPPGEFAFDHSGRVSARFVWAELEAGEPMGPDRVLGECVWTDRGDPLTAADDVERREPPTDLQLRGHGGGFNLDPDATKVVDVSWTVVCGDGVFRLDARDVVKFDRECCAEGLDPALAAWLD